MVYIRFDIAQQCHQIWLECQFSLEMTRLSIGYGENGGRRVSREHVISQRSGEICLFGKVCQLVIYCLFNLNLTSEGPE
jgi:hypothetical protein